MDRRSLVLRIIYAVCLLGATLNHALITARHGIFWDYGGEVPAASAAFWTSLGVIDPAAAALLFLRPNLGVLATLLIIVVDVVHNVWIGARYFPPLLPGLLRNPNLMAQIAFMIFMLSTARFARRPAAH